MFNPGSNAAILHSFTVFKKVSPKNYFCQIFNIKLWKEVTEAQWWPAKNGNCYEIRKIEDEYENMFVKDKKDIMVSIPGRIDFCEYKFLVKTSNGGQILYTQNWRGLRAKGTGTW